MAVNLWVQGGNPTSYNPLPTGWNTYIGIGIREYTIRFKAKSMSGATLRITDDSVGGLDIDNRPVLSSEFKTIEYTFKSINQQNLSLYDLNSKGDIIIEDIQLIEKSTGVATINGIDGFLSGNWTINSEAKVIDDETLVLNATGGFQGSLLTIQAQPNTAYTLSGEVIGSGGYLSVYEFNGGSSIIERKLFSGTSSITFSTGSTTNIFKIYATNPSIGTFTFKRPMLNIGSIPAPYEKKRGDRMVLPVPKKNLLQGFKSGKWTIHANMTVIDDETLELNATGVDQKSSFSFFDLKENQIYTYSAELSTGARLEVFCFDDATSGSLIGSGYSDKVSPVNITIPMGTKRTEMRLTNRNSGNGTFTFKRPQLEEGTVATSYEPYAVQINQKSARRTPTDSGVLSAVKTVPKKNLLQGFLSGKWTIHANATVIDDETLILNVTAGYQNNIIDIPIIPFMTYTLSIESGHKISANFLKQDKTLIGSGNPYSTLKSVSYTATSDSAYIRVYLGSDTVDGNVNWKRPQLEEGTVATSYEPYMLTKNKLSLQVKQAVR